MKRQFLQAENKTIQTAKEKTFFKILKFLSRAAAVPVPDGNRNFNDSSKIGKIYAVIACLLVLTGVITSIAFKMQFYKTVHKSMVISDILTNVCAGISTILTIVLINFLNAYKNWRIAVSLGKIERNLAEKLEIFIFQRENFLLLNFTFLQVAVAILIIYDLYMWIPMTGLIFYLTSIALRHLCVFIISASLMQIQLLTESLRECFEGVNKKMRETMTFPMKFNNPSSGRLEINCFSKIYDGLVEVSQLISDVFGLQIASICLLIVVCLIHSSNLSIKFALQFENMGFKWNIALLVADQLHSFIYVIFGVILAVSCEKVSRAADNTSVTAYKILIGFPSCPRTEIEKAARKELFVLGERFSQRNMRISAAGLFPVGNSVLFNIFGSITAYVLVFLQIK